MNFEPPTLNSGLLPEKPTHVLSYQELLRRRTETLARLQGVREALRSLDEDPDVLDKA